MFINGYLATKLHPHSAKKQQCEKNSSFSGDKCKKYPLIIPNKILTLTF